MVRKSDESDWMINLEIKMTYFVSASAGSGAGRRTMTRPAEHSEVKKVRFCDPPPQALTHRVRHEWETKPLLEN